MVGVRVCATSVWDVLNQATVAVLIKVSVLDVDARVLTQLPSVASASRGNVA